MSVTPADIEASIASEHYFTAHHGALDRDAVHVPELHFLDGLPDELELLTFCVLVLRNGHTVSGESHCQDPAKFDAQIGREEARKDAINKLWPMAVYAARSQLALPVVDHKQV